MADQPQRVGVEFLRHSGIHQAGDKAGFPPAQAEALVRAGVAMPVSREDGKDEFDVLDRAQLLDHARLHFGIVEAPPPDRSDDEVRNALRAHKAAASAAGFQTAAVYPDDHPNQHNIADVQTGELRGNGTPNAVKPGRVSKALKFIEAQAPLLSPSGDQLEAMDRPHLEAYAKEKCGFTTIDPAMTDAELRDQVRAVAAHKTV